MNCLDCLDRTNTVQSFLALEVCPRRGPGLRRQGPGRAPSSARRGRRRRPGFLTGRWCGTRFSRLAGLPVTRHRQTFHAPFVMPPIHGGPRRQVRLEEHRCRVRVPGNGPWEAGEVRLGLRPGRETEPGSPLGGGGGVAAAALQACPPAPAVRPAGGGAGRPAGLGGVIKLESVAGGCGGSPPSLTQGFPPSSRRGTG